MIDTSTSVRDRSTDAPSMPAHTEKAGDLTDLIGTAIPAQRDRVEVREIDAVAAEEAEQAAEEWRIIFVSIGLLMLFVVIFVGYIVFDAARLLP